MKIGIMTWWWSDNNYGQLLQCYALQKYLQDLGYDAFLIDYKEESNTLSLDKVIRIFSTPKKAFGKITKYLRKDNQQIFNAEYKKEKQRLFSDFLEKYVKKTKTKYRCYSELKKNPPDATFYIVGSDQIWHHERGYNKNLFNAYFLNFGNQNTKCISYAASFGVDSIPDIVLKDIKPLLQKFSCVTVRENTGKQICHKIGIESTVVCDPTLLLDFSKWSELFDSSKTPKDKYIFAYLLTSPCNISVKKLKEWATKKNLHLIYVRGNHGYDIDFEDANIEQSYLTINQWLHCLANAEYVVTNSFHGTVLSLIFKRRLGVIPLIGELSRTNDRLFSLFKNLKIQKTEIIENDYSILENTLPQTIDTDFIRFSKNLLNYVLTNKTD